MKIKQVWVLAWALVFSLQVQAAEWIQGKVVGVSDGDTVTVLDAGKQRYRIRLDQIDAPESKQPFGTASKRALSDLIFNRQVKVQLHGKDRYKRYLGTIYVGSTNINLQMVRNGHAWAYQRYLRDKAYQSAEKQAQAEHRGLWSQRNAVPPWEWRNPKK
ncbi:thermonuclease family protein [Oligella urethralis]|uniref:thermonuclease family protein n=1 Tax=Oligella urethralis TaxID=90245 RepID=UPI00037AFB5A|nr:thermonuclease family protein [Oligella urethralis]SUA67700.1 Thermonuclease precursor [Oligella urethralis]